MERTDYVKRREIIVIVVIFVCVDLLLHCCPSGLLIPGGLRLYEIYINMYCMFLQTIGNISY